MARKVISSVFICAGIICIFVAGIIFGQNQQSEQFAELQVENMLASVSYEIAIAESLNADYDITPDYILDSSRDMPVSNINGLDIIGQIDIPSQNISLPVCSEWRSDNAKSAPCLYMGSVYDSNMIIAGHSYKAHFRGLYNLNAGDSVTFTDMDGNVFDYVISEVETLDEYNHDGLTSGDWDLSLFTCTSNSRGRVVVRCDLIEREDLA